MASLWRTFVGHKKRPSIDSAVVTFIQAGGDQIEELCDLMSMNPIDLYEAVSESQKTNVRTRMNPANQVLLRKHIHEKLFGHA